MNRESRIAERFFGFVTGYPGSVLVLSFLVLASMAAFVPRLHKDTTPDALIAADNPAVVYRDKVKKIFGLDDPFVVAVIDRDKTGIYDPETLALVARLSDKVGRLRNIDPDRVTSLATESNIVGTPDGMEVTEFDELGADGGLDPAAIEAAIANFPLYQGSIVSRDGSGTLIVAAIGVTAAWV